jgi:hypothetical protein
MTAAGTPLDGLAVGPAELTAAAVVLLGDATRLVGSADDLRRRLLELTGYGVHVGVGPRSATAPWAGLRAPGPGRLVLAAEEREGEALDRLFAEFTRAGIGSGLVLVVDASARAGGTRATQAGRAAVVRVAEEREVYRLLDLQERRHERYRVPGIDEDPDWTVVFDEGCSSGRRAVEAELTLAGGQIATRHAAAEGGTGSLPMLLAAGVYDGAGGDQHLLVGPDWAHVDLTPVPDRDLRTLDLRSGVVHRVETDADGEPLRSLRLTSIVHHGVLAMRVEAGSDRLSVGPVPGLETQGDAPSPDRYRQVLGEAGGGIGILVRQRSGRDGSVRTLERVVAVDAEPTGRPSAERAGALLSQSAGDFERLLREQRAAWATRWDHVGVSIEGDPDVQLALRFALFHLWGLTGRVAELAVGARGLSGPAYSGHVFWDADAYVLPALATIDPESARAMVRYRTRRLEPARVTARNLGYFGARFPWESARDGVDVTPDFGYVGSERIPIVCGELEEHISADIAWAVAHLASWTAEPLDLARPEGELVLETARYWASRSHVDDAGRAHILGVVGPDEYHERVDDNAFTNVMARWNLRTAARLGEGHLPRSQVRQWTDLADRLVDGYDPTTGRYEQFRGFYDLEPMVARDIAPPPVAADILVGRERIEAVQVIKQPDVLMLHHLVPEEVAPGSLPPNLDFYGPRTAHGSSLSPAVMASLLARAGRTDEALEHLRLALAIDLENLGGTTGGGLHMAALAGAWTALLRGFLGIAVRDGALLLDPRVPSSWGRVEVRFHVLGRLVRVVAHDDRVDVTSDGPLTVRLADGRPVRLGGGRVHVLGREGS